MANQLNNPAETAPAVPQRYTPRLQLVNYRKDIGIFLLLVALLALPGILKVHSFYGSDNLGDLARLIGISGIFGIGAGVVIITGGIDLTVGSVFALEGVLLALALNSGHFSWVVVVIGILLFTMGLGLIHGLMITRIPLQPFIVTLCGLMIYRGLARFVSQDDTEGFGDGTGFMGLNNLTTGSFHNVPNPFWIMIVIAVIMWVVVHRSVYGRYLFAVGKNEEAARYSGINSLWVLTMAYVIAGLLTGIAGILFAFYTNSISPATHGQSYELYGIAAAVLGGCSLRGGEGSVVGILIGTALLQVLQNLVNLLGIPSSLNFAVVGAVIVLGVTTDEIIKRRSARVKTS
jgi:ribose transport system permease protein